MIDQYSKNFINIQLGFLMNRKWIVNSKFNVVISSSEPWDFDLVFHGDNGDIVYMKTIVHKIISLNVDYIHERATIDLSEKCFLCGRMDIEHGSDRKHRE